MEPILSCLCGGTSSQWFYFSLKHKMSVSCGNKGIRQDSFFLTRNRIYMDFVVSQKIKLLCSQVFLKSKYFRGENNTNQ